MQTFVWSITSEWDGCPTRAGKPCPYNSWISRCATCSDTGMTCRSISAFPHFTRKTYVPDPVRNSTRSSWALPDEIPSTLLLYEPFSQIIFPDSVITGFRFPVRGMCIWAVVFAGIVTFSSKVPGRLYHSEEIIPAGVFRLAFTNRRSPTGCGLMIIDS